MIYPTYEQLIELLPAPCEHNVESFELRVLKEIFEIDEQIVVNRRLNELRVTFPMGKHLRGRIWIKRVMAQLDGTDENNFDRIVAALLRITEMPKYPEDSRTYLNPYIDNIKPRGIKP